MKINEYEKLKELDKRVCELEGITREEKKKQVENDEHKTRNVVFIVQICGFTVLLGLAIMFFVLGGTIHDGFYSPRCYASGSVVSAMFLILLYTHFYWYRDYKETAFFKEQNLKELLDALTEENKKFAKEISEMKTKKTGAPKTKSKKGSRG